MIVHAVIALIGSALQAGANVVQNKRKSKRLRDCLEAIVPPLQTIEASESKIPVAHKATLEKLKDIVNDAKALLEKQCKKKYVSQYLTSSSVKQQFADIIEGIQTHMQALNLSVATLHRVDSNARDADDAADVEEMQAEIRKMMQGNQDELRSQLAELDAGQQGRAQEMLEKLTEGQQQLRREISDDLKKIISDIAPARHADSGALPKVDMALDLKSAGGGEDDVLGAGGFGEVTKMRWVPGGSIDVAVKRILQRKPSRKALEELRREAEAMHAMRHPNVIQLYGASLTPPHVCLVLEFAPHGSLMDLLEQEGAPSGRTKWRERLILASDIVKGLTYLHYRGMLHLDIKSGNVLLFDGKSRHVAKLSDFGLAYIKNETSAGSTVATRTGAGTINWKAPELFRKTGKATKRSDIYSCSCVMFELASGTIPWDGEGPGEIAGMVSVGERPDKPEGCIDAFWDLIEAGWQATPEDRISLADSLEQLEALIKEHGGTDAELTSPPAPKKDPEPEPEPNPDTEPEPEEELDPISEIEPSFCTECGAELEDGDDFCGNCGTKKAFCTECGAEMEGGDDFCGQCGTKKGGPVAPGEIVVEVPQVVAPIVTPPVPQTYTPYSNTGATVQAKPEPMYSDDHEAGNIFRNFAVLHVIFEFVNLIIACTFASEDVDLYSYNLVKIWAGLAAFGATLIMITSGIIAIRPKVFYPDNRKHMIIKGAVLNAVLTLLAFIFSCGFLTMIADWRETCEYWENSPYGYYRSTLAGLKEGCDAARLDAAVGITAFCLVLRILITGTVVRCSLCLPVSYYKPRDGDRDGHSNDRDRENIDLCGCCVVK